MAGNECHIRGIVAQRNSNNNLGRIARIWHKKLKKFSTRTELVNPPTSSLVIIKMSTPVVSSVKSSASKVASATKVVKEKKPRAPTLPAKFSKFIQFGYWFMSKLNEDSDDSVPKAVDETLYIEKLNLYSDIESQQAFVQGFFDESKDIAKTIRQTLLQKKKDEVKAAKAALKQQSKTEKDSTKSEKKPLRSEKKKEKVDSDPNPDASDPEKKPRGRKPKTKVLTSQDAFVNEMVQLANGEPITTPTESTPNASPTKEVKVKEVKPKEDKVKEVKVKEVKPKEVKPKDVKVKEDKVKEDKPKDNKTKPKSKSNDNDDSQTAVSVLNLHGNQYLIDDNQIVYNFLTHEIIGSFDPSTLSILTN